MSNVVWIHSKEDLANEIGLSAKVVVRFTGESWCRPCQQFAPHYERAAENVQDVRFLSVDIDTNPWAMEHFGVQSVPTVMLFEHGKHVRNIKAPQSAINFIKDIKE